MIVFSAASFKMIFHPTQLEFPRKECAFLNAVRYSVKDTGIILTLWLALIANVPRVDAQDLTRLKFNHPGLVVDLAVGLWAWPLPMDLDGDGDLDLAVSCPDKPYNGLYFFENPGAATGLLPTFRPPRRIGKGIQDAQVSYVDARARVLSPAREYRDFLKTGFAKPIKLPPPENVSSA